MQKAIILLDKNKADEYIEMISNLLQKAKGNYIKTVLTVNLSVGYGDKKDFNKAIELLESVSEMRMYNDVKMCYNLNLCCYYYYSNQTEKAKILYNEGKKIFKPFRVHKLYGGNIATLDMFIGIVNEDYETVEEQLIIAKENWKNPRLQEDYLHIENILKEHLQKRTPIYEEFSQDKCYKYEIYEIANGNFDVWILHFCKERKEYFDLNDNRHIVDTLDMAKEIGQLLIKESKQNINE